MLVTVLLNLVASLIRSVLSGAFAPPAPDATGTFSAAASGEVKPRAKHPKWELLLR